MIVTTLLAHLVGDYILQWDSLARWKGRELKGVLAHGLIVLLVTGAFSLPLDMNWWPWVLLIGLSHTAIDAIPLWLGKRVPLQTAGTLALARFVVDQMLHLGVIIAALTLSGYVAPSWLAADLAGKLAEGNAAPVAVRNERPRGVDPRGQRIGNGSRHSATVSAR